MGVKLLYNPGNREFRSAGVQSLKSAFQTKLWEPALSREQGLQAPVEQPKRTGKKGCDSQKSSGVNMLQSLFVLQLPLIHNPFNKVRGIFFERTVSARLYCVKDVSACICVCIVGCDYTAHMSKQRKALVYANSDKTEFMPFKQDGAISILNGKPLKLVG